MTVQLNPTIVWRHDHHVSASFLADLLGLAEPTRFGPFLIAAHVLSGAALPCRRRLGRAPLMLSTM